MTRLKWSLYLMLGWVMIFASACGASAPALPDGPALIMFYTDG